MYIDFQTKDNFILMNVKLDWTLSQPHHRVYVCEGLTQTLRHTHTCFRVLIVISEIKIAFLSSYKDAVPPLSERCGLIGSSLR